MRISIVMPTYNGGKFLKHIMDSLYYQTRKADEVIFIDDRSDDDTVDIIKYYIDEKKISTWRVIENPVNLGVWRNFKRAWKYASGDLILFCDQDDIWHRDKLLIYDRAFSNEAGIDVLASGKEDFYDYKMVIDRDELLFDGTLLEHAGMHRNSFFTYEYPGCCLGVRKSFMDSIECYWEGEEWPYDSFIRIMSTVKDTFYYYHADLVYQRLYDNNLTQRGSDSHSFSYQKTDSDVRKKMMNAALKYAEDAASDISDGIIKTVRRAAGWAELRNRFYDKGRLTDGIRLVRFLDCYPRYKAFFDDLFYVMVFRSTQNDVIGGRDNV